MLSMTIRRLESLPQMGWLCSVRDGRVSVVCGRAVETKERFIVAGCWAGEYCEGGIHHADCVFGSGCVVDEDRLIVVPSTATTDSVFWTERGRAVTVSNSLPLLLAASGDQLDPQYSDYHRDLASIARGIDEYAEIIPTCFGAVRRLLHRNLLIGRDGICHIDKPWPPSFDCYSAYESYLEGTLDRLFQNARSQLRRSPLRVLTTQSRGYDTTAVNALAARHGVEMAFTCTASKGLGRYADSDALLEESDDGSEIAERLGIPCAAIDRRAFERPFDNEELYFAAQPTTGDLNLLGINQEVRKPSILLTGTLGEIWYTEDYHGHNPGFRSAELRRWDLGGHGLAEVGIYYGFVQCAVPFIGARRRADIVRITHMPEMAPWRLGVRYDRPIPRRIAESRGVDRGMFGQKKLASVVDTASPCIPVTAALRNEYFAFLRQEGILGPWAIGMLPYVRRLNEWLAFHPWRWQMERVASLSPRWRADSTLQLWSWLNGRVFCYSVNKCAEKYRSGLSSETRCFE